jgi:hypothetical protein
VYHVRVLPGDNSFFTPPHFLVPALSLFPGHVTDKKRRLVRDNRAVLGTKEMRLWLKSLGSGEINLHGGCRPSMGHKQRLDWKVAQELKLREACERVLIHKHNPVFREVAVLESHNTVSAPVPAAGVWSARSPEAQPTGKGWPCPRMRWRGLR